jgi:hypothetical protein
MNSSGIQILRHALPSFREAIEAIQHTFQMEDARSIAAAANEKKIPRSGKCENGYDYFVHGFGYTVVIPPEAQVHIDGGSDGDYFTIYDMALFLETSGLHPSPEYAEIREGCEILCTTGELEKVREEKYRLIIT